MEEENKLADSLQAKYDFYFQEVHEHPESIHLLVSLADACLALSQRREALLYYKKAMAIDPMNDQIIRLVQGSFSAEELKGVEMSYSAIPFWQRPGKVIGYPLRGQSRYTLVFASFVGAACDSVPLVGDFLMIGFVLPAIFPFLFAVLQSSIRGQTEIAEWPSFADFWEHYIRPDLMVLISAGVAFGPIVIHRILASYLHVRLPFLVPFGLITGAFYLPMALLACGVSEKLLVSFQFRTILTGIWKIRGPYSIFLACALAVIGLYWLIARFIPYSIFFLGPALLWLLTTYVAIVLMRILGNTFAINRHRLKWRQ